VAFEPLEDCVGLRRKSRAPLPRGLELASSKRREGSKDGDLASESNERVDGNIASRRENRIDDTTAILVTEVGVRIPAIAITRFGASRSRVSRHRDHVVRRIAIGAKRRLFWGLV